MPVLVNNYSLKSGTISKATDKGGGLGCLFHRLILDCKFGGRSSADRAASSPDFGRSDEKDSYSHNPRIHSGDVRWPASPLYVLQMRILVREEGAAASLQVTRVNIMRTIYIAALKYGDSEKRAL